MTHLDVAGNPQRQLQQLTPFADFPCGCADLRGISPLWSTTSAGGTRLRAAEWA